MAIVDSQDFIGARGHITVDMHDTGTVDLTVQDGTLDAAAGISLSLREAIALRDALSDFLGDF